MQGNLVVRLLGLAVIAGCIAYIVHLQSEVSRLQSELTTARKAPAARPTAPAAAAAARPTPAQAVAAGPPRVLDEAKRKAIVEKLGGPGGTANPVWFATVPNNPEAAAFQKQLQSAFEEAGWVVRGNTSVRFSMKPGIFVFAADETPPDYVQTAQDALDAAGIKVVSSGRGYRDFYNAKKQENPNWIGFELADDQSYVIVVGRKPEEEPASQPES